MSETVFVLGASVSHPAGAPSMKDFIDPADGLPRAMSYHDTKNSSNSHSISDIRRWPWRSIHLRAPRQHCW